MIVMISLVMIFIILIDTYDNMIEPVVHCNIASNDTFRLTHDGRNNEKS